jgi:hypothetical protein
MSSDRELQELAAKAAGLTVVPGGVYSLGNGEGIDCTDMLWIRSGELCGKDVYWDPLADDGDALRLAVALRLTVQVRDDHVKVGWSGCVQWIGEDCLPCDSASMPAATRRAIVRAAAELGRTMAPNATPKEQDKP